MMLGVILWMVLCCFFLCTVLCQVRFCARFGSVHGSVSGPVLFSVLCRVRFCVRFCARFGSVLGSVHGSVLCSVLCPVRFCARFGSVLGSVPGPVLCQVRFCARSGSVPGSVLCPVLCPVRLMPKPGGCCAHGPVPSPPGLPRRRRRGRGEFSPSLVRCPAGREQRTEGRPEGGTEGRTDGRTDGGARAVSARPSGRTRKPNTGAGGTKVALFPPAAQPRASGVSGAMATAELTELEMAIERIVTVFCTFAAKEGRKGTLTAGEFKELVRLQLPNLMKDVPSLEEKMSELDVNNDEELRFGEYWRLIGELAKAMRKEKAGKK